MNPRTYATIPVALLAAQLLAGCGGPAPRRPVRIECSEPTMVASAFPSFGPWLSGSEGERLAGLLLRDGDLMLASRDADHVWVLPYAGDDGPRLDLVWSGWHLRLSSKIVTLNLGPDSVRTVLRSAAGRESVVTMVSAETDSARRWLTMATERELAGLRLLGVDGSLSGASLAAVKRLSRVNRHVGLVLESRDAFVQVLPLFEPRVLWLQRWDTDIHGTAANLGRVETLLMADPDSASLELLRSLPHLRQLYIDAWSQGALPSGFAGLKALIVAEPDSPAALESLPVGLEELSLLEVDSLDLAQLPPLPKLHTLVLNGSELAGGPASLDRFKGLRWLGLPENTTQAQLATVLERHPGLTTLEINAVDSLKDLTPLRAARGLQAVIVNSESVAHLDVIRELKSLRFVAIIADTTEASRQQFASIRKALPDALVVQVTHFCLGSGWILLLFPATAACWLFGMRSRSRKPAHADG